jgi:putative DNA methylase
MITQDRERRLIESDSFPFEFLSRLAERESWRKELHRPVYHVHKWWAKRLGSIFRGVLLGCELPESTDLVGEFHRSHAMDGRIVFDPFMGSGTTVGEAHKLGFTALGRDINPVAVDAVTTAFGPLDRRELRTAFDRLSSQVGERIRPLYRSRDSRGRPCDVLYFFWAMQAMCPDCECLTDLFSSYVIARHAHPRKQGHIQVLCPNCGDIFPPGGVLGEVTCRLCKIAFDPSNACSRGARATCRGCGRAFVIVDAMARANSRPRYRLYGKLVLTRDGRKEYLAATDDDRAEYDRTAAELQTAMRAGDLDLPDLDLAYGYNTRQAMRYGFRSWRDFFNDRQLLALGLLRRAIAELDDVSTRRAMMTLFSGVLEFNNLFASYKGEGTGAVRHMFSHHILKPERTPIEANVWGTAKSSGSFSNLFRSRLLKAIEYRLAPTELRGTTQPGRACSPPFSGKVEAGWPCNADFAPRAIYLSCGDSSHTDLPDKCIDFVVTDPPFFDNVHYSELADFFFAWQQLDRENAGLSQRTTRNPAEVQDTDSTRFSEKLQQVFAECRRVLKDDGLLVFTYHHSRNEGWQSLANAILGAGFRVVNSQPVKAEMSVATPKSQAKDPIQLDSIIVCTKARPSDEPTTTVATAMESALLKVDRFNREGFRLSRNDRKVVFYGQALTTIRDPSDLERLADCIEGLLDQEGSQGRNVVCRPAQGLLFD